MNKKHITLILIAIFLFSTISLSVSAQTIGYALDSLFDRMNEFFEGGWQRYDALLSFFLIFILLFSASYAGLKKVFGDDKEKEKGIRSRPAIGIALAFAGIGAAGIVSGFGFRIAEYGYIFIWFLLIILVFIIYALLLKLGLEKHKLLAFLIALIIVTILALLALSYFEYRGIGWRGFGLGGVRGPSVGGIRTPDWIKNIFAKKEDRERVREPVKAPVGPKQGQVEGEAKFWNGAWRDPGYVRGDTGQMWDGKEWVCPKGTHLDKKKEKCVPDEKKDEGKPFVRFTNPWFSLPLVGILLVILFVIGARRRSKGKKLKKPEEEKPEEDVQEEETLEDKIKKLQEVIDNLKEQKDRVSNSIDKELKKEKKDAAKLLSEVQDFKKWFKRNKKDPAWLGDTTKGSEVVERLSKEKDVLVKLLADEQVLERDLLDLLRLEKALERIHGQLQQVENLDPVLKTKLPPEMQKMAHIIREIEDDIKKLSPHLKEEVLTEERLKDLVDIKNAEERTKPTWIKYKQTDEEKIEQLIAQDKTFLDSIRQQIIEEKSILERISKILRGEVEELEEKEGEIKSEFDKLLKEAETLENEPHKDYGEAIKRLTEAKKICSEDQRTSIQERIDRLKKKEETRRKVVGGMIELTEKANEIMIKNESGR